MLNVQVPHLDFWVGFFVFDLCRYKWVHLMPLSVCGEPWVCVYWVADVIRDTPLLRWKVKYYKALCVLTILLQIGSRNVCLHSCHCFQILNKHCNMLCVHCIVKFIKVKNMGEGDDYLKLCCWEIKWYTFYRDCIVSIYLIQKNKFIEFSRHVYLWIQRFLMKQIPNKNESHAFEFTKKVV